MAITAQKSAIVTALDAGGLSNFQETRKVIQRPLVIMLSFTQVGAGDQNSTADLCFLPPGRHRVYAGFLDYPAMTNGALQVGHTGYTQSDGTVVAASATALVGSTTTTSAGRANLASGFFDYESASPVRVQLKGTGTGGIEDAKVFTGILNITQL